MNIYKILEKIADRKIYIWGAGRFGNVVGNFLCYHNIEWEGYIDNNKFNQYIYINEIKKFVYSPIIIDFSNTIVLISVLSIESAKSIENQLLGYKVNKDNIVNLFPYVKIIYSDAVKSPGCLRYTEKILKVKNKYMGERAFIIGNGPSLRLEDLNKIIKEYSFATNSIINCFDKTIWRPSFYFTRDELCSRDILGDENNLIMLSKECKYIFLSVFDSNLLRLEIENRFNNILFFSYLYNNIILYKKGLYDSFEFAADNCEKGVNLAGTILFSVLEFAIYMGFKELYLLGVDNSYTLDPEKDKIRNYSEILNGKDIIDGMYYDMSSFSADTHLMEIGYITAKKYADSHGIKIYNATRGGKLEVFPRVDFDKLF